MKPVFCALIVTVLVICAGFATSSPAADQPEGTDVMLLFDTTSSMYDVLESASREGEEIITKLSTEVPNLRYGLAEVRDVAATFDPSHPDLVPWRLVVPLTTKRGSMVDGINSLTTRGGGDGPEAYSRALWETIHNPNVQWRPDAAHLIILIGDSVPHDNDLNDGIPSSQWIHPSPWDTKAEPTDPAGVIGTTITPDTNLDWQAVLAGMGTAGFQLEMIVYDEEGSYAYWINWAERTGGEAVRGDEQAIGEKLVTLVKAAAARACQPVRGSSGKRLLASLRCSGALAISAETCDSPVVLTKRLQKVRGLRRLKGRSRLVRLVRKLRNSAFLHRAPRALKDPDRVLRWLERQRTAIGWIETLPGLSKAVGPRDFDRIAASIAELEGVKPCASSLLHAVE